MSVTTVENVLLDVLVIFTLIFSKDKKVDLKSLSTTNPKPYLHNIFLVFADNKYGRRSRILFSLNS